MEMSSGQQRLLFAVVVVLLAGLGIYLVGPGTHHGAAAAPPTPSPSSSPPAAASGSPTALPPSTVPPYTPPPTTPASAGGVDIYQWLPFTQQNLSQAAQATLAFAADYDTFSYTETAPVYARKMAGVATSEFDATLENDYTTLDVATQRSAQKQVSTSSGGVVSISSFGSGEITFVVNITQRLTTTKGTTSNTTQYDVTVVSGGTAWQVNNIEMAGTGDQ